VQNKLLDLYTSPYMSSSVKLHIITALDQTTRLKEGLDWLLGRHHVQVASTSSIVPASSKPTSSTTGAELAGEADVQKESVSETSAASDKDSEAGHLTGYQRILSIMNTKQVRYTFTVLLSLHQLSLLPLCAFCRLKCQSFCL